MFDKESRPPAILLVGPRAARDLVKIDPRFHNELLRLLWRLSTVYLVKHVDLSVVGVVWFLETILHDDLARILSMAFESFFAELPTTKVDLLTEAWDRDSDSAQLCRYIWRGRDIVQV